MCMVAVVQLDSREDIDYNLHTAITMIREASGYGADMVVLPENFLYIGPNKNISFSLESPEIRELKKQAKKCSVYLVAGSIPEKSTHETKQHNMCAIIDRHGRIIGKYHKMHLFDTKLGDSVEFQESSYIIAGKKPVVVATDVGAIGLSICYDLRFPELYRHISLLGGQIACVPSNFTMRTGRDHWEVLLRARAIENGMYILAANQWGEKYDGNKSYGRSAIIDPWGIVVAQASDTAPCVIYVDIDFELVKSVRETVPSLSHIKLFRLPRNVTR